MATVRDYKSDSIIYFQGDQAKDVYVLKEGHVILAYPDVRTGEERQEQVQIGEFFGIISSLARLPREETAKAVTNASVVVFPDLQEFGKYAIKNPALITNMLQAFSERLREVHKSLDTVAGTSGIQSDSSSEVSLLALGKYYHREAQYDYAAHIYSKCIESGLTSPDIKNLLVLAKSNKLIIE